MPTLTPGLAMLSRGFLNLCVASAIVYGLRFIIYQRFGLYIPSWVLITSTVLGIPLVLAIRIQMDEMHQRRRAKALGARIAPRIQGNLIGNFDVLRTMLKNWRGGYPADGQWEWMQILGPTFNLRVFWEDIIFTVQPEIIKIILATDFANYEKGAKFRASMASVLGTGVFNSDGDMWKFHRSMTRPFFSRDRISHFDNFDRHAADAIHQMKERFKAGYAVDFQDVISRFTLDSATEFLFGNDVKSLSTGLPYPHNVTPPVVIKPGRSEDFAVAFGEAQYMISARARMGWIWPLMEIFHDKTKVPMKIVNAYLDPILKEAVEKHKSMPAGLEKKADEITDDETLLDHLVKITTDQIVLKDEILNILIAGRDTTAATLTFTIYLLATNPEILARLRAEVLEKVGPSARPTYDDIRDMKYLRAVINETLRLYPAVPFDVRETVHETTWPSADPLEKPIYIPAKTSVPYSVFVSQRREDLWGPDSQEFDPDRFLDDRVKKYLTNNPFIFVPFNAGPRICLGQQFAYNEMSFMLIRLLQNFSSISLDSDAQPPETRPPAEWATERGRKGQEKMWPKMHLTMYSHGGLWVKMVEADHA